MFIDRDGLSAARERACASEAIHRPGAIQPHGALLRFGGVDARLIQWAGDCAGYCGVQPAPGMALEAVIGADLAAIVVRLAAADEGEPVYAGRLARPGCVPAAVSVHRASGSLVVELEPACPGSSGLEALERARSASARVMSADGLEAACAAAAAEVRAITGFDRVMVYRFEEDFSGTVLCEASDSGDGGFAGHRFPASDVPEQARALYARNLLRVIADVDYRPAPLQPAAAGRPLDMSNCVLRAIAPVHLQYLRNMGVRASMSASIMVDGRLWGLVACHHFRPRTVPAEARLLCRHVAAKLGAFIRGDSLAREAALRERHARALEEALDALRASEDAERALRASLDGLRSLVACGGVALLAGKVVAARAGELPPDSALARLAALAERELRGRESWATDRLGIDHPAAARLAPLASGMLAVRIQAWRPLTLLWLRPEQVEEVRWAGNPCSQSAAETPLSPRRSFAAWKETVRGRSRPWSAEDVQTVHQFRARADFILQRQRLEQVNRSLEQANARLNLLATTDPLTGLANRRSFEERLKSEWKRCGRSGAPIALVAVDVDHFKQYNDHFGHPAGDECLAIIAAALEDARRSGDLAARVGGEEFALVLPDTGEAAAVTVAERLRQLVESRALGHPHGCGGLVTVSLGVAAGRTRDLGDPEALWAFADRALYDAKSAGRNRVARYSVETAP